MTRYHAIKYVHVDYTTGTETFHDCPDKAILHALGKPSPVVRSALMQSGCVELEPLVTVPGRLAAVGLPHGVPACVPVAVLQDLANHQWINEDGPTHDELRMT